MPVALALVELSSVSLASNLFSSSFPAAYNVPTGERVSPESEVEEDEGAKTHLQLPKLVLCHLPLGPELLGDLDNVLVTQRVEVVARELELEADGLDEHSPLERTLLVSLQKEKTGGEHSPSGCALTRGDAKLT